MVFVKYYTGQKQGLFMCSKPKWQMKVQQNLIFYLLFNRNEFVYWTVNDQIR